MKQCLRASIEVFTFFSYVLGPENVNMSICANRAAAPSTPAWPSANCSRRPSTTSPATVTTFSVCVVTKLGKCVFLREITIVDWLWELGWLMVGRETDVVDD